MTWRASGRTRRSSAFRSSQRLTMSAPLTLLTQFLSCTGLEPQLLFHTHCVTRRPARLVSCFPQAYAFSKQIDLIDSCPLDCRDIEALPQASAARKPAAESPQGGPNLILNPPSQRTDAATEDDSGMVMLEDDGPAPSCNGEVSKQTRRGDDADGKALEGASGLAPTQKPSRHTAAGGQGDCNSPPPFKQFSLEGKISCKAPIARARQQQKEQQQKQQQTAGAASSGAPAQPSHSPSPPGKVRKYVNVLAVGDPQARSSDGVAKRQRTQPAADDEQPAEEHDKAAAGGRLSDDGGSQVRVAGRRSTGSNAAGRNVFDSGVQMMAGVVALCGTSRRHAALALSLEECTCPVYMAVP